MSTKTAQNKQKSGQKTKGDWHHKIAKSRGEKWRKNMLAGRRDALINPSIIRLVRLKENIHQSKLAEKIKVSESTFGAIERGKRPVKKDVALAIARELDRPLQKLFKEATKNKFVAVIQKQAI